MPELIKTNIPIEAMFFDGSNAIEIEHWAKHDSVRAMAVHNLQVKIDGFYNYFTEPVYIVKDLLSEFHIYSELEFSILTNK